MYKLEAGLHRVEYDRLMEFYHPEVFLPYCQVCPNYGARWSCPPYHQPLPRLDQFPEAYLLWVKILYDRQTRRQTVGSFEVEQVYRQAMGPVKRWAEDWAMDQQARLPGSMALSCGGCQRCWRCARLDGQPCRYPDQPRFSLESLGFHVAGIAEQLLGQQILWASKTLPAYHLLIGGVFWKKGPPPEQPLLPAIEEG